MHSSILFLIFDFETLSNIPLQAPIISLGAVSGNFGDSVSLSFSSSVSGLARAPQVQSCVRSSARFNAGAVHR